MVSNAPSADRLQQAETIDPPRVDRSSFRQGWRVRTRLDGLLADRSIGPGVWQAAVEYRDAWARVSGDRSSALGAGRISGGRDAHDRQIAVVDTLAELAVVERRIEPARVEPLCFACAVNDLLAGDRLGVAVEEPYGADLDRACPPRARRSLGYAAPGDVSGRLSRPEPKSRLRPS